MRALHSALYVVIYMSNGKIMRNLGEPSVGSRRQHLVIDIISLLLFVPIWILSLVSSLIRRYRDKKRIK
jgi:hypothetical protein